MTSETETECRLGDPLGKRKLPINDMGEDSAKRLKEGDPSDKLDFDPASLVRSREGVNKPIQSYLEKHLKRRLSKEEREALFKEHPRPDLDVTLPPKVDKYVSEFLGKKFPRYHDNELMKIQATVLACIHPLTTAWQELIEDGLETEPELMVPPRAVVEIIQRSLCLIGSAAEGISQDRKTKILEAIDQGKHTPVLFEGALLPCMGAGRARLLSHTGARPSLVPIPAGEKRREVEVVTGQMVTLRPCTPVSQYPCTP